MTKDEPPRHRRRTDQIASQQRVQNLEAGGRRKLGDGRGKIRLERVPCDGSGTHQRELLDRQRRELLGQRCRDRRRHGHPGDGGGLGALVQHRVQPALLARPPELVEIKRVAATVTVDRGGRSRLDPLEQLVRLALGERVERNPADGGAR